VNASKQLLRRFALDAAVALCILTGIAAFADRGRYGLEMQQNGILGVLCLPSLLIFQFGYMISAAVLLWMSRGATYGRVFRAIPFLSAFAALVYCSSLLLTYQASRAGEFGIGVAGFAAIFLFLPSAAFLLIAIPAAVIYALCKSTAEQTD
jgi:hypothetical protein